LIWTGSRSFVLGLLVKPFLAGTLEKWLFGMGTVKMVTNGGPQMHLQMAPLVSKHWGAPHCASPAGTRFEPRRSATACSM
jgi:hypothetical protein